MGTPCDCDMRLHPKTPIAARTNKPMVRNATMIGKEPLEEKRSDVDCPLQPLGSSVGVEQPEVKVPVGINEYV